MDASAENKNNVVKDSEYYKMIRLQENCFAAYKMLDWWAAGVRSERQIKNLIREIEKEMKSCGGSILDLPQPSL